MLFVRVFNLNLPLKVNQVTKVSKKKSCLPIIFRYFSTVNPIKILIENKKEFSLLKKSDKCSYRNLTE